MTKVLTQVSPVLIITGDTTNGNGPGGLHWKYD